MAAVTDTGTIQFSRTAADTRTVFNSRTVTNSGAITRAVTNAAAVGTGLAAAAGYIGTGIGLDFVARHRTITVAIIAVTGTIIIAAGIGEVVAFAERAATRTVRGTNASFAVLPASAAVIITGTRVAVLAGRIFCG